MDRLDRSSRALSVYSACLQNRKIMLISKILRCAQ